LAATTKDFHGVYDELTKELRCNPSSMRALSNIGILLVNWGRIDDGIAEIKKALIIEPHNIPTLERLGYAYLKKGLLGTASLYFKRMNSLGHRDMRALLYLSQIYILSGQEEKAKSILTRFVDIMQDRNLIPFLDDLQQETSLLQTTPDLHILLPLLRKVYQQRTILVEENSKSLLNISKE
jgi:tetratricopeptide (TPR) repeat protein